jgi:YbgC/YbaW family acyl-CoA thioester hydrolase
MRHEHRLTVQSYECDANGHVNNAVYLNYLESARVAFLRGAGISYRELRERGFNLVVVRICIDYRSEARMEDPLLVVTEPLKKRITGGIFSQKVYREEAAGPRMLADAEVTWVSVDGRGKPTRIPAVLDLASLEPPLPDGTA